MDVFNKICNSVAGTVAGTVNQLSNALPGNPVTREYEATKLIGSAGPGLLWKIYSGHKKSTKQEVSVFVLEKKCLDRFVRKSDREALLTSYRKGVAQLTKLRHPRLLVVQHALEESRDSLAFVSEPVRESLLNLLKTEDAIYPVEIKYGLIQLSEALQFIHKEGRLLHMNICPENIIVNASGAWKLAGFDFALSAAPDPQQPSWSAEESDWSLPIECRPFSDITAPELSLSQLATPANDMFSLGCLAYAVFNKGRPLLARESDAQAPTRNLHKLKQLNVAQLTSVPDGLKDYVKMLLNIKPELRPDAHQFTQIEYFQDVTVKTLNYLDSLFQWDNLQKSQFYKGLPQILPQLPHRVCLLRVIPCLAKEFVNHTMVPFVLPNVLQISEKSTKDEFTQYILPSLIPVLKIVEPVQVLLILMQRMELLLKLTPAEYVRSDVMPVMHRALDSMDQQAAQELCLAALPGVASLIDYPAMKNALLPRILRVCLTTPHTSVRVNCLVCLGKLLEHLDKWLVYDQVLPFLPKITSREPAVLMGILGVYKLALTLPKLGISKEVLATQVIPFLFPLTVENSLTLSQFGMLMGLLKDMTARVEAEQKEKLEQISGLQKEQQSASISLVTPPGQLVAAPPPQSELDSFFSSLGIDTAADSTPKPAPKAPMTITPSASTGSLSLEDKQRLARQQEESRGMKSSTNGHTQRPITSPVTPSPAPKPSSSLMDGFLESNLKQMSFTPQKPIMQQTQPTQMPTLPIMQSPTQPTWNTGNTMGGMNAMPASNWSMMPSNSPARPMGMMQQQQPPHLTSPNMMMSPSSFSQPMYGQQNKPAKQLTAAEMQDLLS
ncbi:SCY1-like protein 2 [Cloeon dipterum]|uniref:SCY1-like protein 2 n=1 Tax=Cloeon dipterum TaxID=197152 RepID=UPI00322042FB